MIKCLAFINNRSKIATLRVTLLRTISGSIRQPQFHEIGLETDSDCGRMIREEENKLNKSTTSGMSIPIDCSGETELKKLSFIECVFNLENHEQLRN
ncbi:hypothetical protein CDAR_436821 [Caerostris darwini]|uniref:Uncharacterized protein n=1 Tax=Caerostris darwini TaxID=1538125 RepID=A0AAV4TDD4_9ARAC|nr:hypothetical protein CDAR_436821 [Caerostris darwini]